MRRRRLCTPLLLRRLLRRFGRCFRDSGALPAFAVGNPNVIDRMFDRVQAWARGKHPSRENALDLCLQRHLVDFDKSIRIWSFRWRTRVAHAWRHLQSAELHRFVDRDIKGNNAPGDLVEACGCCRDDGAPAAVPRVARRPPTKHEMLCYASVLSVWPRQSAIAAAAGPNEPAAIEPPRLRQRTDAAATAAGRCSRATTSARSGAARGGRRSRTNADRLAAGPGVAA